jgi:hypothetical protein
MVLDSPLRIDTRLSAGFLKRSVRRVRGKRKRARPRLSRALIVGYGRTARLRGRLLTSEGVPLSDAPISVRARIATRRGNRLLGQTTTNRDGRFSFRVRSGPSRYLRVSFGGTRILRPALATARLRVRALATLRLSPRRLRVGQVLTFRGTVKGNRTLFPGRGKLVQVQFRDGRSWRPAVKLGRTNRAGRYRIRYRFRRITRPTRILFRILVPAEGAWPYETGWSRRRFVDVYPRR